MQAIRVTNTDGISGAVRGAANERTEQVAMLRILWAGPLAVLVATAATLAALRVLLAMLPPVNPAFVELAPQAVAMATAVLCACAIPVFALTARFAGRPLRTFQVISAGALLLSWVPDLLLLSAPISTAGTVAALMVLHLVAAIALVWTLTALTRAA